MKKVILSLLIVASFALSNNAQAQTRRSYYYYPEANVYYSPQTHQYAYDNNGTWSYQRRLPSNITVRPNDHVTVYGIDNEIWRQNQEHRDKYKNWKHKTKKHKTKIKTSGHSNGHN